MSYEPSKVYVLMEFFKFCIRIILRKIYIPAFTQACVIPQKVCNENEKKIKIDGRFKQDY